MMLRLLFGIKGAIWTEICFILYKFMGANEKIHVLYTLLIKMLAKWKNKKIYFNLKKS